MNPINNVVTRVFGEDDRPNAQKIKGKLLDRLPLVILIQEQSLDKSLEAVKASIEEQNQSRRMRITLPADELVSTVMRKALELKKFEQFAEYASCDAGKAIADKIVGALARDESIESLEQLVAVAPDHARQKLVILLLSLAQKQVRENEGFELDPPISEIAGKLSGFDAHIYDSLKGSVSGPQFKTLGESEMVPEPYRSLFAVIGELEDCLKNEVTLNRFQSIAEKINSNLGNLKTTSEKALILSAYRQIAAEFLLALALKVQPQLEKEEVHTHNPEELSRFNALKESIQNAAALLGAEIAVEREMKTENDALLAAFLGMGFSTEEISAWFANPPNDDLLFTLWITEEGNTRIEERSIYELYAKFKEQSQSPPALDSFTEHGFLFTDQPNEREILEWARGKRDMAEFISWHMQNANSGTLAPGSFSSDEYYNLFKALNL